jgi:hypothetical protein
MDYTDRLRKEDWCVRSIPHALAKKLVEQYHYAHGGSNTMIYTHGLFHVAEPDVCKGVAWWLAPTKSAALATYPKRWQGVLSLTRLVVVPGVPKNACTFLLARSMKLIDRNLWPCLVTYADTWQGHVGTIYKASNWQYMGMTKPQPLWVRDGRLVAIKAGPKTRTRQEMEALGCVFLGKSQKHKFVHIQEQPPKAGGRSTGQTRALKEQLDETLSR